jgi:hypothetical protein
MSINEYETYDQREIAYLYHLRIPYEMDKENPRQIKFIFKGDLDFMKERLEDFWSGNTRVDALTLLQDWQSVKSMMWVGNAYNPNYYKKPNENNDTRTPDKQEK